MMADSYVRMDIDFEDPVVWTEKRLRLMGRGVVRGGEAAARLVVNTIIALMRREEPPYLRTYTSFRVKALKKHLRRGHHGQIERQFYRFIFGSRSVRMQAQEFGPDRYEQYVHPYKRRRGSGPEHLVRGHKRMMPVQRRRYFARAFAMVGGDVRVPMERAMRIVAEEGRAPRSAELTRGLRGATVRGWADLRDARGRL